MRVRMMEKKKVIKGRPSHGLEKYVSGKLPNFPLIGF